MRRILVLRGGALGDFIVTLPALAALRRRWPEARIELAGNRSPAVLARNRGVVDAVHSQDDARWSALFAPGPLPGDFAGWLATFDLVLSFWPDPDGELRRRFPSRPGQVFISAPAMPTVAPAAAHYLSALQSLDVEGVEAWFRLDPLNATAAQDRMKAPIAVHPGSGSPTKNWPAAHWISLLSRLIGPTVLFAGEVERGAWSEARLRDADLGARFDDGSLQVRIDLPLEELVSELSGCRAFIGHDSGVSHVAAACGVPCVLLFGPTDPEMWAPPAPHVQVLRRGHELSSLSVDEVHAALLRVAERG